ncbi:MAG: hypothetical protein ACYDHH_15375, partial [Solirubrobacteraceae bacterium]
MELIVKNGLVVTPAGVIRGGLVAEDGVITHVGADASLPGRADAIDAEGKWVMPGIIDPHTHVGGGPSTATLDRLRASWTSESRGAAHKGITTIISFHGGSPWDPREPSVPTVEQEIAWAEQVSYTDFAFHVIMQSAEHVAEQRVLAERGVVGFKHFYTAYKPGRDATADQISIGYT